MVIEEIKEIVASAIPVVSKYDKNNNVEIEEIAIDTMLFPIRIIVKARSYLSIIFNNILGMVFPSSASTCILNLLQQAMEVSAPEKKKCKIINTTMIIHDIAGSGIKQPLPF